MSFFNNLSIRLKMRLIILGCGTLAMALLAVVLLAYDSSSYRKNMSHELAMLVDVVGANCASPLLFKDEEFAAVTLESLSAASYVQHAVLYDEFGTEVATYGSSDTSSHHETAPTLTSEPTFGRNSASFSRPVLWQNETIGSIFIEMSLDDLHERQLKFSTYLFLTIVGVSGLGMALAERLQKTISDPILELDRAASLVQEDRNYSIRVPQRRTDEIGHMVGTFNQMLDRIQENDRELQDAHDSLEDRVVERTKDLEEAKVAAESAVKAKSEFLANISHELRTPMHGILSFSQFGIRNGPTAKRDKLLDYFEKIRLSAEGLMGLLNDLLDLSKLDAGMMTYQLSPTLIDDVVGRAVDEFQSLAHSQAVTIVSGESIGITIDLDQVRLLQVLRNLLANAVRFSPTGGVVRVEISRDEESVLISVVDQGAGVPHDELDKIFEKFVQSASTKTGAGGTGLGLSICKEIVMAHGGQIWAENNERRGATIHFRLPLAAQSAGVPHEEVPT